MTSSPLFPQSNGQAERTVQTVKRLMKESPDPNMALLMYRSTPFQWCGLSPAELLMGRRLRSNIPLLCEQLTPNWEFLGDFRRNNHVFKLRQKHDYDRHHATQTLSPIPPNSDVWITTGESPQPGTIISSANTPRSYMVNTSGGHVRRNRQHLNVNPNQITSDQPQSPAKNTIMTRSKTGTQILPPERL